MISREEAKEVYFKYAGEFSKEERVELMYDAIKDSIGSCGECEHSYEHYKVVLKGTLWCGTMDDDGGQMVDKDFFCANFKRKET